MKKKIIIIAIVVIIAIVCLILLNKKTSESSTSGNKLFSSSTKYSYDNQYGDSLYRDDNSDNKDAVDPQHQLSWPKSVYEQAASDIFNLFDGFTNDEEEEAVKNIIKRYVLTDADWLQLEQAYGTDSSKMSLVQRCQDEDISREQLNKILASNGLTVRV